jgi:arsenite methyltransferase
MSDAHDHQANNPIAESYGRVADDPERVKQGKDDFAQSVGYSSDELAVIPEEANLALSCGNPTALASLREGESVLDLGSGAGFDCFLAANQVGEKGRVIGVDLTPEMVTKAREIAKRRDVSNVEFRHGAIEDLPIDDASIDVVISNCVINLSDNKDRVYAEVFRVLRPGGRIAISDASCSGPIDIAQYLKAIQRAGFTNIRITPKGSVACSDPYVSEVASEQSSTTNIYAVYVEATKEV